MTQASLSVGLRLISSTTLKSRGRAKQVRALEAQWMLPRRTALDAREQGKKERGSGGGRVDRRAALCASQRLGLGLWRVTCDLHTAGQVEDDCRWWVVILLPALQLVDVNDGLPPPSVSFTLLQAKRPLSSILLRRTHQ